MTLYTSKVIAQWLCLTERRVRQLRDEGVIVVHPRVGGKVLKASGYKTESYKPPLVNPCDITTADRYMTRMPGEDLYSGETPAQRSAQQLMEEYSRLNDATTRREEWMAVQAIVTGQVPVVGEGVNEIIDFWPEVEPSVEEYLQERLQAQVERVLARAGKK